MMADSDVSKTVMARTWTLLELSKAMRSCNRPMRLGMNTENWQTASGCRPRISFVVMPQLATPGPGVQWMFAEASVFTNGRSALPTRRPVESARAPFPLRRVQKLGVLPRGPPSCLAAIGTAQDAGYLRRNP